MPTYPAFTTCLMIGGLGSGAFHTSGMVHAAMSGGSKPTTSTSVFFLGGQTGLALGPFIAGLIIAPLGLIGMPIMASFTLPAVVLMLIFMNDELPLVHKHAPAAETTRQERRHGAAALLVTAFILFIMLRSGTSQGFATLLPSYFEGLGYPPAQFGLMLGVFSFAGAIGTFIGGYLGDRYNRRQIMMFSSMAAAPFAFLMLYTTGAAYYVVAVFAGLLLSMPHSILLVMTQELAPHRRPGGRHGAGLYLCQRLHPGMAAVDRRHQPRPPAGADGGGVFPAHCRPSGDSPARGAASGAAAACACTLAGKPGVGSRLR